MVDKDVRQSRLGYIIKVMVDCKIQGNPTKYVVLRNHCEIVDNDRDYELKFPQLPPHPGIQTGRQFWAYNSAEPVLTEVRVVLDQVDGVLVKPLDYNVEFLVQRDELYQSPIPGRPLAVRRSKLSEWIGVEFAERIRRNRVAANGG